MIKILRITQTYADKFAKLKPSSNPTQAPVKKTTQFSNNFIQTLKPDYQFIKNNPEDIALNKYTSAFLGKFNFMIIYNKFTNQIKESHQNL